MSGKHDRNRAFASFFLLFKNYSAKIVHNAVSVENTPWQATVDQSSANWQSFLHTYAYMRGASFMSVSYKKLWKLLIDKDMKKKDLCEKAGISSSSVTKMGKNGHVTTEVLLKICTALDCGINDIVEIVPVNAETKDL
jgi:DNA-binding Xre family transcriptional regulator